jgi:hypothetical protein
VAGIDALDWKAVARAEAIGYAYALEALRAWREGASRSAGGPSPS